MFTHDTLQSTAIASRRFRCGLIFLVALGTVPLFGARQASAEGDAYLGRVTGDRVRLRTGGSRNHYPFSYVMRDQSVVVLQEKNGWAQILVPRWIPLYVHRDYVALPELTQGFGRVTGSNLVVRVVPERQHEAVAVLPRDTGVNVLGQQGDWLKISPPPGAQCWLYGRYIEKVRDLTGSQIQSVWASLTGSEPVPVRELTLGVSRRDTETTRPADTARPSPGAAARPAEAAPRPSGREAEPRLAAGRPDTRLVSRRLARIYEELGREVQAEPAGQRNLEPFEKAFTAVVFTSEDLTEIRQARQGLEYIEKLESRGERLRTVLDILEDARERDERLREQLKKYRISRLSLNGGKDRKADRPLARGWVKSNGRFAGRQGTHSLYVGTKVRYFLRSQVRGIDLDDYVGKRVALHGVVVELDPKFGADLIDVTDVKVLAHR